MKIKLMLSATGLVFSLNSQAALLDLSGKGFVTYGDFQSYSLPIADIDVPSTPGKISDLIVVATGSSGNPVNTNFVGMDDAYSTPSGQSGSNFFSTGTYADPGAASQFAGDDAGTWDTSLLALQNFLDTEELVFFFNNNNLNGANEQSLAAWMQVKVKDSLGALLGTYDLTNNNKKYGLVSEGGGGVFNGERM